MIVNNSTNINKTNSHPSHQIIENKNRRRHNTLQIQVSLTCGGIPDRIYLGDAVHGINNIKFTT